MAEVFANDGSATVTAGGTTAPSAGTGESWTLSGSTLPAVSSSAAPPTWCYVADVTAGAEPEKILVTNISGATATVTRGADGTIPIAHTTPFTIQQVVARASLKSFVTPPALTVTAAQVGVTYAGMSMSMRVLTGAALSQPGTVAGNSTFGTPQDQAVTPSASGSVVYGAALGVADGTFAPTGASSYFQDYETTYSLGQLRNTGYTSAGTPVTLGNSGTDYGVVFALAEILAASGGALAEDPSSPIPTAYSAVTTMTTAAFQPPPSSLLVLMVSAVGSLHSFSGVTAIGVTDSSGLGLNWVQAAAQNANGSGYAGVWIAQVPSGFAGQALAISDQTPALEAGFAAGGPIAGPSGSTGLFWLLAGLAGRNLAACNIPVLGDSITEGMGATAWANRWTSVATRESRNRWPTAANGAGGGMGFIPMEGTGETTFTWPVSLNSSSGLIGNETFGPTRSAIGMFSAASTFTFTAPAGTTSATVMYYNSGDGAQFSYQRNSNSPVTVTCSGTAADGALTSSITLASGDTLSVTWVSGHPYLEGIIHYAGDESSGVTWHGLGHFGWDTGTSSTGWNQTQAQSVDWRASIAALSPSAIGIDLSTNDSGVSIAPAQSAANITTLITYLRGNTTLAPLPVLLFIPVFTVDAGSQAYPTALRGLVNTVAGLWPVDMNYRILSEPYAPSLYYSGGVHPDDAGHALYGATAAARVTIT